jgi:hypothetical protein
VSIRAHYCSFKLEVAPFFKAQKHRGIGTKCQQLISNTMVKVVCLSKIITKKYHGKTKSTCWNWKWRERRKEGVEWGISICTKAGPHLFVRTQQHAWFVGSALWGPPTCEKNIGQESGNNGIFAHLWEKYNRSVDRPPFFLEFSESAPSSTSPHAMNHVIICNYVASF